MLLSKSTCVILLASSPLLNKAQGREVIGYRTVNKEEADLINLFGKPFRDKKFDGDKTSYIHQLGNGFYMSNKPASWVADPWDWYCAIRADADKIRKADKIFIPKYWNRATSDGLLRKYLWGGKEDFILEYIGSMISDPEEAIRFGWIVYHEWELQMVIPTDMLNEDEFDLWGECFETKDELMRHSSAIIEWATWNIIGNPGYPGGRRGVW
ncbi:hypothetical protein LZ554_008098 [Drepanopeziza brunnea f. sp. 'monogermtubi']|nr:hypothetical protein LZ554_008098 [Drepanopeziza brunnea f. sp. 'monogermtubi']